MSTVTTEIPAGVRAAVEAAKADVCALHAYLRWRNANARHPDVLAAQRRERARIRSERQQRWGRPRRKAA